MEQIFHIAPIHQPDAPEPLRAGELLALPEAIKRQDAGLGNLAILPVDTADLAAQAVKGQTGPARGWYGVLAEFPAWDVTLECQRALPARLDAVLFPLAPGSATYPAVERLRADAQVTAFQITGGSFDDSFILCEEDTGPVTVGDITFEGRALLLRRPTMQALAVAPVSLTVGGKSVDLA